MDDSSTAEELTTFQILWLMFDLFQLNLLPVQSHQAAIILNNKVPYPKKRTTPQGER